MKWYPEVSASTWIKKYPGLSATRLNLCVCGRAFTNLKAFVELDTVGFECECVCKRKNVTVVTTNRVRQEKWCKLLGAT